MTFWGAFNSNIGQNCAFYSRNLPKKWTFDQKMRILFKFQHGAQSIQAAHCNDTDTVGMFNSNYIVPENGTVNIYVMGYN